MLNKERSRFPFVRIITSLVLMLVLFTSINVIAQYRVNKNYYDYRGYTYQTEDPYHPGVCGIASFLIPGEKFAPALTMRYSF